MNTGSNGETALLLRNPEVQARIVELRDSDKYSNWDILRDKVNEEFKANISLSALKSAYNKKIATSVTISGSKDNPLKELASNMAVRLESIMGLSDLMSKELKRSIEWLISADELEPIQRMEAVGKVTRTLESLNNSFIKQLNLVSNQLDQVKVEQTKIQWDEAKVHEEINRILPNLLKSLEEEDENGEQRIIVMDRSLLKE